MTSQNNPSEDELKILSESLTYDPKSGLIKWKIRPASHFSSLSAFKRVNLSFSGKEAGRIHRLRHGKYKRIGVNRKNYLSHRVAWFLYYGEWPRCIIDHVNGDGLDNRIENLRESSDHLNMKNKKLYSKSKCRIPGVYFRPERKRKWAAMIRDNGHLIHLGSFPTLLDAASARKSAELQLGFSTRHGT